MAGGTLLLTMRTNAGAERRDVPVTQAIIAGWTGRDPVAVEKHITELEALGVSRPTSTPVFYRVSSARLTVADRIEVIGNRSSGEVEFLLLQVDGRLWVGVGSDHTDRETETYDVAVSKQMCEKPIAGEFWLMEEVADHWESLVLRSHVEDGGRRTLYQEGAVAAMLEPAELISRFCGAGRLQEGTLMFCGTLAARGGVRPSASFAFELEDPRRDRRIRHAYRTIELPRVR